MKDDTMDVLCQLKERAVKDVKKLLMKDDIKPEEWKTAGEAIDIIKDITTTKAMMEEYPDDEEGYSMRGYRKGGMSSYGMYPDWDGYSASHMGNRRMYMNDGSVNRHGASYAGDMNNAAANLRNLMNQTTNEHERSMYARWLEEAERSNR